MRRLIFAALILSCGCAGLHVRPQVAGAPSDPVVAEAQDFVSAVADKMPAWDGDVVIAQYEGVEIARVKDDIRQARDPGRRRRFLNDVDQLRTDWDALVALDMNLRQNLVL